MPMTQPPSDYTDAPTIVTPVVPAPAARSATARTGSGDPLMDPLLYVVVFLGGFLGTAMRYGLSLLIPRPAAETGFLSAFHTATFTANMLACFIFACLTAAMGQATWIRAHRRELVNRGVGMGMCGGFSTLSALVIEELLAWHGGNFLGVAFYEIMSFACGLALAYAGTRLGLALTARRALLHRLQDAANAGSVSNTGDIPITMEDADAAADAFLAAHPADDGGMSAATPSPRDESFAPPMSGPVAEAPTEVFARQPMRVAASREAGSGLGLLNGGSDHAEANPIAPLPALVFPSFQEESAAATAPTEMTATEEEDAAEPEPVDESGPVPVDAAEPDASAPEPATEATDVPVAEPADVAEPATVQPDVTEPTVPEPEPDTAEPADVPAAEPATVPEPANVQPDAAEPDDATRKPVVIPHVVSEADDDTPNFGRIVTEVNERRKDEEAAR